MIVNFFYYLFCKRKEKIVYKLFYYVNKSIKSLELLKMLFDLNEISIEKNNYIRDYATCNNHLFINYCFSIKSYI